MHPPIQNERQNTPDVGRASWNMVANPKSPINSRSLNIFVDLGLSNAQIAKYYAVPETKVVSLRRYYGLDK